MPGSYVHLYFADRILRHLSIGSASVVNLYPDAYKLGALGADVFDDVGRLHAEMDVTSAYDLFNECGAYIYTTGLKTQLSYCLGMLTHYVLDSRLTPYVMYLVENGAPHYYDEGRTSLTKQEIIAGLDYYVARAYLSEILDKLTHFEVKKIVADDVADLYENAVFHSVRHSIDPEKITHSLFDLDLSEKKPVDMLNVDYMNTREREWATVRNGEWTTNMSIDTFFEKMEPIVLKLIDDFMARARSSVELNKKAFVVGFTGIINK